MDSFALNPVLSTLANTHLSDLKDPALISAAGVFSALRAFTINPRWSKAYGAVSIGAVAISYWTSDLTPALLGAATYFTVQATRSAAIAWHNYDDRIPEQRAKQVNIAKWAFRFAVGFTLGSQLFFKHKIDPTTGWIIATAFCTCAADAIGKRLIIDDIKLDGAQVRACLMAGVLGTAQYAANKHGLDPIAMGGIATTAALCMTNKTKEIHIKGIDIDGARPRLVLLSLAGAFQLIFGHSSSSKMLTAKAVVDFGAPVLKLGKIQSKSIQSSLSNATTALHVKLTVSPKTTFLSAAKQLSSYGNRIAQSLKPAGKFAVGQAAHREI